MLTPDGQSADKTDKIMLLAMWANTLSDESALMPAIDNKKTPLISAGMGKPTFPINQHTINIQLAYWQKVEALAKAAMSSSGDIKERAVIGYGDPRGDEHSRKIMAGAMSKWYQAPIASDEVLFTVGGAGALRVLFETFNMLYKDIPRYRVITPFPHYTLYKDNRHLLHSIDVMKEPGYRLTARSLQSSIEQAYAQAEIDQGHPKVILLCNPNNPLGTIIGKDELIQIAEVLRRYPELHIVLDEAYAEMSFDSKKIPSLLAIAPDLKNRVVMMRSATKALSAAGERMAVLMAFDKQLMGQLLDKNISTIGHAPRSSQIAYAETMAQFTDENHQALIDFYQPKVTYVAERLRAMGAAMPDPDYKVDGAFYVMSDFSDLFGLELSENAARALQKRGPVTTNEELAYYLLFNDAVMIAPSSYFGMSEKSGFMRITCSGDEVELCELMDRLESRLLEARRNKKIELLNNIARQLPDLRDVDKVNHDLIIVRLAELSGSGGNSISLKEQNVVLKEIQNHIQMCTNRVTELGKFSASTKIQSMYRGHLALKERARVADDMRNEWGVFVHKMISGSSAMKSYFLNLSVVERLSIVPWKEYLKNKTNQSENVEVNVDKTNVSHRFDIK